MENELRNKLIVRFACEDFHLLIADIGPQEAEERLRQLNLVLESLRAEFEDTSKDKFILEHRSG
jgi:hypothetical protein